MRVKEKQAEQLAVPQGGRLEERSAQRQVAEREKPGLLEGERFVLAVPQGERFVSEERLAVPQGEKVAQREQELAEAQVRAAQKLQTRAKSLAARQ